VLCASLLGCLGAPKLAAPDRSGVWGYLRLVPHEGVPAPGTAGGGTPYADRRYADAELVDYTRPGFAVVYLEGPVPGAAPLELAITASLAGIRIEPGNAVLPAGGRIVVRNATEQDRVLTCPAAGVVQRLAPGEQAAFEAPGAGALDLFVPGAAQAGAPPVSARLFAAPGPYARVDRAGRYELMEVSPGLRRLHAWHPRFPPASRAVRLERGGVLRVDLELGVGLDAGADGAL
jgi:hypothetical protein